MDTLTSLTNFAERVKAVAGGAMPAARMVPDSTNVWVHNVWALGAFDCDLDTFKARLVAANNARLLTLVRCDMVEAFDPFDVRRSRVDHPLGPWWNFVRAD